MDPGYVNSIAFRTMFLRSNEYNAKLSADHMLRFFEIKKMLFGQDKLVKDITMADLAEDDIACLKAGFIQSIGKDRSGRQILLITGSPTEMVKSFLRAQYFVTMRLLQSEETQLRGIVSIWYFVGDCKFPSSFRGSKEDFAATRAPPQNPQAFHVCVDDMYQYVLLNSMIKLMRGKLRARLRVHYGSQMECLYQLSTFGIQSQSIPLDANGKLNLSNHINWVNACAIEDKVPLLDSTPSIINPTPNDVLFTGCRITKQPGNQYFLALVQEYSNVYNDAPSKRKIVDEIIDKIHDQGGRFLGQTTAASTPWEEVPLEALRIKITQSFRNHRRLRKRQESN